MRDDSTIEVYVEPGDFGRDVRVAIFHRIEGEDPRIAMVTDGGRLEFHPFTRGLITPPTIALSREMAKQLLAGLLAINVPSPSAGAIEGELKATKTHLEDMRRLVKIPKRTEP